jgi:hypothetical protein
MSATAKPKSAKALPSWWTDLDKSVAGRLRADHGRRCDDIAQQIRANPTLVRGVLRGLEHLGYAEQRGGYWFWTR